ncbi:MAG: alpha/beta hydrolase [Planctomycetales bacterium]|nr:alpha/beta hydrolase [Planctomycetales bacterium]MBN8627567.1 alpha/beta hydrolase [Planctomycetota bacterium]
MLRWLPWRAIRWFAIAYLSVLLMLLFVENRLIFAPTRNPRGTWNPPTSQGESVSFAASDGTKLTGWYLPHRQPSAVVLFACGNGGNVSYWADYFRTLQLQTRAAIFGFNYRGYGTSEGSPSEKGVLDDARSARRWLATREQVPEDQIVLIGRSLGGGVVVDLAQDGCRALVVESSFTSLPDVAARIYPFLPVRYVMRTRFDSLRKISAYDGPLFVSHGDADDLIPITMGRALYDTAPGNLKRFFTVEAGGHNDPQPPEYFRELAEFLEQLPSR